MTDSLRASYDAMPYESKPISATNLDQVAAIAMLHGLTPASPDECRVLELGCASGGNLVSMACRHRRSSFLGIDLSPAQVDDGRRSITSLGLTNVTLEARSITEAGANDGPFDYIICHGVFSWVPDEVREAILRVCADCLAPHGVAYISYNTYPGWHARMVVRDMILLNDDPSLPPARRVARARSFVERIGALAAASPGPYGATFHDELATLRSQPDSQLLHEQLEPFNTPMLFSDFIGRAKQHRLQHIADARLSDSRWPDPDARPSSRDAVAAREQESDFVAGRAFRRSLVCRDDLSLDTSRAAETVRELYVVMRAVPVEPSADADENAPGVRVFRSPDGVRLGTASPVLLAAFDTLGEAGPASLPVTEVSAAVRRRLAAAGAATAEANSEIDQLPTLLLRMARAGMVAFDASPSQFTILISERPTASALARWQASRRGFISNMQHSVVKVAPLGVFLLPYLDGTRDRGQLVLEVQRALDDGRMSVASRPDAAQIAGAVDESLRFLASSALLVA
jgi:SAM-dependent methyltransferase